MESLKSSVVFTIFFCFAAGIILGVGFFTFFYAKGTSYFSSDSKACANCHVMQPHFDAWLKSSHRLAAQCNDCHTPHNALGKYLVKAENGFWHSFAFTTGLYEDNFAIRPRNLIVANRACRSCHAEIITAKNVYHGDADEATCTSCHQNVGHHQ